MVTDPTLDWLRSEMQDARERSGALVCWNCGGDGVEVYADLSEYRCHVCHGLGVPNRNHDTDTIQGAALDLPAALSVLDRIGTDLADADMDALFDALERLEDACGPEVVEVLGELRDVALRREVDDA